MTLSYPTGHDEIIAGIAPRRGWTDDDRRSSPHRLPFRALAFGRELLTRSFPYDFSTKRVLPTLELPVLLLHGTHDAMVPAGPHEELG
jgi:pimeloyl-ACP methyl ester carboxylesterase